MTTTSKQIEKEQEETFSQTVTLGGVLRNVDPDSGMAEFNWNGIDRPVYFHSELESEVRSLAGKCVQVYGIGTFKEYGDKLTRIDLEAIRQEPVSYRGGWPESDPNPVEHASFDFDVDEFLRGIYEARRG